MIKQIDLKVFEEMKVRDILKQIVFFNENLENKSDVNDNIIEFSKNKTLFLKNILISILKMINEEESLKQLTLGEYVSNYSDILAPKLGTFSNLRDFTNSLAENMIKSNISNIQLSNKEIENHLYDIEQEAIDFILTINSIDEIFSKNQPKFTIQPDLYKSLYSNASKNFKKLLSIYLTNVISEIGQYYKYRIKDIIRKIIADNHDYKDIDDSKLEIKIFITEDLDINIVYYNVDNPYKQIVLRFGKFHLIKDEDKNVYLYATFSELAKHIKQAENSSIHSQKIQNSLLKDKILVSTIPYTLSNRKYYFNSNHKDLTIEYNFVPQVDIEFFMYAFSTQINHIYVILFDK